MKKFSGERKYNGGTIVRLNDRIIENKRQLKFPFTWGDFNSGSRDLAYSILYYTFGKEIAEKYYKKYLHDVIVVLKFPQEWEIKMKEVIQWFMQISYEG